MDICVTNQPSRGPLRPANSSDRPAFTTIPHPGLVQLQRSPHNPIITTENIPIPARSVFNPGVIKHQGTYVMLANVCLPHNPIVLWRLRSEDGVRFKADPSPLPWPAPDPNHEESCVYDPRITFIEGRYIIMYASQGHHGVRVGVIETEDFETYHRLPIASEIENRNAVLFPERINGLYARLDRPFQGDGRHGMWISYSPDLVYWGRSKQVLACRSGLWDGHKLGAGAVPIRTDSGWLCLYHGVWGNQNNKIYQLGVCLLDLEDPSKVLARGTFPVLTPKDLYESTGYVPNVVFTANAVLEPDGMVRVYYGAADTCVGLAQAPLEQLIEGCFV